MSANDVKKAAARGAQLPTGDEHADTSGDPAASNDRSRDARTDGPAKAVKPASVPAPAKAKKGVKTSTLRTLTALCVFAVVGAGLAFNTGLGTPSSFGWDAIATVCPLGWLQTMLATKTVLPRGLVCIELTVVLILLFGRAFCGWLCPTPLVRRIFGGKKRMDADRSDLKDSCVQGCAACRHACLVKKLDKIDLPDAEAGAAAAKDRTAAESAAVAQVGAIEAKRTYTDGTVHVVPALAQARELAGEERAQAATPGAARAKRIPLKNGPRDSRLAVLVGALLTTAVFGFPVFCLVCPVGLSVATFIGVWRLVQYNDPSWSLIVFPAIIIVELVVMKKWCHRFCPLSALTSLVAKGNVTLRPTIDAEACLVESGRKACHTCYLTCPEAIDLHNLVAGAPLNECLKCRACADACPEHAITFPLRPVRVEPGTRVTLRSRVQA